MRSLALALALAAAPAAAQQAPLGTVRSDRSAVELVPPRAGASEIRTPEGFIRVERGAIGPGAASFGTYPAGATVPPAPPRLAGPPPGPQGSEAPPSLDPCRPERARYLRRLLYMSGIDLEDPVAFLDGLAGREPAPDALLFTVYGLLPGVDPIRPLAWDQELRSLGRELARCQRGGAR